MGFRKYDKKALIVGTSEASGDIGYICGQLGIIPEMVDIPQRLQKRLKDQDTCIVIFDGDQLKSKDNDKYLKMIGIARGSKKDFIIVSADKEPDAVIKAKDLGAADYIVQPFNYREFIARFVAVINKKIRVSCIGGGTGLFNFLSALKAFPNVLLTSIVNMSDSGGSSGRMRVSFGILPPGDVRRSLIALSNAPKEMNELMQYRFKKGESLRGHSFGNLFLAALTEIEGSMSGAVKKLGDILNIQGIVIPVTDTQNMLCARFEDGTIIKGEDKIDLAEGRPAGLRIKEVWHEPPAKCDIDAYAAIINSDIVIIGPGDLFTSVIANLIVKCIPQAIWQTAAKKIYICNLMTKPGETSGYSAFDHVKDILRYLGGDYLDYILISNSKLSDDAIAHYKAKGQSPVSAVNVKDILSITKADVIFADIGHETDLVRHDEGKTRNAIGKIIEKIAK